MEKFNVTLLFNIWCCFKSVAARIVAFWCGCSCSCCCGCSCCCLCQVGNTKSCNLPILLFQPEHLVEYGLLVSGNVLLPVFKIFHTDHPFADLLLNGLHLLHLRLHHVHHFVHRHRASPVAQLTSQNSHPNRFGLNKNKTIPSDEMFNVREHCSNIDMMHNTGELSKNQSQWNVMGRRYQQQSTRNWERSWMEVDNRIPFFPKLRQCQIPMSPCWCQGCCSFQKPGIPHYPLWRKKWATCAINSSFSVRLSPAAAFAFNSQRRRFEQSSWSWFTIIHIYTLSDDLSNWKFFQ